jgi:hypothetical protein
MHWFHNLCVHTPYREHCWDLYSSQKWDSITGWLVPIVSRVYSGPNLKAQKMSNEDMSTLVEWDHYTLLKHLDPITQWQSTMSQKNRDLNYTTTKAPKRTYFQDCWSYCTCATITYAPLNVHKAITASLVIMTSSCLLHIRTSKF